MSIQSTPVIKNDNTRRQLCQTTNVESAPHTMHLDMPTVQGGSELKSVVTLDIGNQSAEEVPFPINRIKKSTPQKRQNVPWEEGTY